MKPAFAHRSPTVPATFAAAIGISLALLLLRGVGVQNEPTPFLPAIGGAGGRVAADLPAPVKERASEQVGKFAFSPQLVATRTEHFVSPRREAATKAHWVQRRARVGIVQGTPPAPVQVVAAPATPAAPLTTREVFSAPTKTRGKRRGNGHGHGHGHGPTLRSTAGAAAPRANGHGKALGRSSEHHHGVPPGHAKNAPTGPSPAPPATSPKANGGGNGHEGGKK